MASMNFSLPQPMRDFVQRRIDSGQYASVSDYMRDLIRRDQNTINDEERWLRELDTSIAQSLVEMEAGSGRDLDEVCDELVAELKTTDGNTRL